MAFPCQHGTTGTTHPPSLPVLRAADVTLGRRKGGVLHLRHLPLQLAEGRLGLGGAERRLFFWIVIDKHDKGRAMVKQCVNPEF